MQQLQQEVMELRKKNEESLKAAIAGAGGLGLDREWKLLWAQLERLQGAVPVPLKTFQIL